MSQVVHDMDDPSRVVATLDNVSHDYATPSGPAHAVRGVTLQIRAGECVVISGPSGSGKSTLLSLLAGLRSPSNGTVSFVDTSWSSLSERQRAERRRTGIGFVFQSANLVSVLSVRQNVAVPALLRGSHHGAADRDAVTALDRFGLRELADRWPEQLSGGQQQRVAVARATVCGQTLILADEPTGALDTANGRSVFEALASRADSDTAVVIVSHDPRAKDFSSRYLTLTDGILGGE